MAYTGRGGFNDEQDMNDLGRQGVRTETYLCKRLG